MGDVDRARSLINGLQLKQPRLYEALQAILGKLDDLDTSIATVRSTLTSIPGTGLNIAPNVTVFTYRLTRRNIILEWEQPDTSIFAYEIRTGGTNWDNASSILRTSTTSAVFDPLPIGTTIYRIKGIDFDGNVSQDETVLVVEIPIIGNITISSSVIDNNVLLSWTEPDSTWLIDYYEIRRDTNLVGTQKGTFAVLFENIGGEFIYKIKAYDIAGNSGPEGLITIEVRQPPDFDLIATGVDANLDGTKVNAIEYNGRLLVNVNLTKTWSEHFIDGAL